MTSLGNSFGRNEAGAPFSPREQTPNLRINDPQHAWRQRAFWNGSQGHPAQILLLRLLRLRQRRQPTLHGACPRRPQLDLRQLLGPLPAKEALRGRAPALGSRAAIAQGSVATKRQRAARPNPTLSAHADIVLADQRRNRFPRRTWPSARPEEYCAWPRRRTAASQLRPLRRQPLEFGRSDKRPEADLCKPGTCACPGATT